MKQSPLEAPPVADGLGEKADDRLAAPEGVTDPVALASLLVLCLAAFLLVLWTSHLTA
ncbi:MAG: hypothetical protein ACYDGR_07145 [Candidatus Dormibacteria bacterium]